jgi:hypothetical protein
MAAAAVSGASSGAAVKAPASASASAGGAGAGTVPAWIWEYALARAAQSLVDQDVQDGKHWMTVAEGRRHLAPSSSDEHEESALTAWRARGCQD